MAKRKIIYVGGVPYRNWYFNLPMMSDEEEDEVFERVMAIRERLGLKHEDCCNVLHHKRMKDQKI